LPLSPIAVRGQLRACERSKERPKTMAWLKTYWFIIALTVLICGALAYKMAQ
jgi:hypothetical protein